jgi:hypothetical protein
MRRLPLFDHPFADRLILWRSVHGFNVSLELAHRLSIFSERIHVTKARGEWDSSFAGSGHFKSELALRL